jgi:serine hydrolase
MKSQRRNRQRADKGEASTMRILIVPGLGGSGSEHWQSHWEHAAPMATRVQQHDWDFPVRSQWLEKLAGAVADAPGAILVGHSLGCAVITHLAWEYRDLNIAGALLVAPADVEFCETTRLREFAPLPLYRLPFRSVVVASSNDPYVAIYRARAFAVAWGSRFVNIGACGHINIASGFGPWPAGEMILRELMSDCETVRTSRRSLPTYPSIRQSSGS